MAEANVSPNRLVLTTTGAVSGEAPHLPELRVSIKDRNYRVDAQAPDIINKETYEQVFELTVSVNNVNETYRVKLTQEGILKTCQVRFFVNSPYVTTKTNKTSSRITSQQVLNTVLATEKFDDSIIASNLLLSPAKAADILSLVSTDRAQKLFNKIRDIEHSQGSDGKRVSDKILVQLAAINPMLAKALICELINSVNRDEFFRVLRSDIWLKGSTKHALSQVQAACASVLCLIPEADAREVLSVFSAKESAKRLCLDDQARVVKLMNKTIDNYSQGDALTAPEQSINIPGTWWRRAYDVVETVENGGLIIKDINKILSGWDAPLLANLLNSGLRPSVCRTLLKNLPIDKVKSARATLIWPCRQFKQACDLINSGKIHSYQKQRLPICQSLGRKLREFDPRLNHGQEGGVNSVGQSPINPSPVLVRSNSSAQLANPELIVSRGETIPPAAIVKVETSPVTAKKVKQQEGISSSFKSDEANQPEEPSQNLTGPFEPTASNLSISPNPMVDTAVILEPEKVTESISSRVVNGEPSINAIGAEALASVYELELNNLTPTEREVYESIVELIGERDYENTLGELDEATPKVKCLLFRHHNVLELIDSLVAQDKSYIAEIIIPLLEEGSEESKQIVWIICSKLESRKRDELLNYLRGIEEWQYVSPEDQQYREEFKIKPSSEKLSQIFQEIKEDESSHKAESVHQASPTSPQFLSRITGFHETVQRRIPTTSIMKKSSDSITTKSSSAQLNEEYKRSSRIIENAFTLNENYESSDEESETQSSTELGGSWIKVDRNEFEGSVCPEWREGVKASMTAPSSEKRHGIHMSVPPLMLSSGSVTTESIGHPISPTSSDSMTSSIIPSQHMSSILVEPREASLKEGGVDLSPDIIRSYKMAMQSIKPSGVDEWIAVFLLEVSKDLKRVGSFTGLEKSQLRNGLADLMAHRAIMHSCQDETESSAKDHRIRSGGKATMGGYVLSLHDTRAKFESKEIRGEGTEEISTLGIFVNLANELNPYESSVRKTQAIVVDRLELRKKTGIKQREKTSFSESVVIEGRRLGVSEIDPIDCGELMEEVFGLSKFSLEKFEKEIKESETAIRKNRKKFEVLNSQLTSQVESVETEKQETDTPTQENEVTATLSTNLAELEKEHISLLRRKQYWLNEAEKVSEHMTQKSLVSIDVFTERKNTRQEQMLTASICKRRQDLIERTSHKSKAKFDSPVRVKEKFKEKYIHDEVNRKKKVLSRISGSSMSTMKRSVSIKAEKQSTIVRNGYYEVLLKAEGVDVVCNHDETSRLTKAEKAQIAKNFAKNCSVNIPPQDKAIIYNVAIELGIIKDLDEFEDGEFRKAAEFCLNPLSREVVLYIAEHHEDTFMKLIANSCIDLRTLKAKDYPHLRKVLLEHPAVNITPKYREKFIAYAKKVGLIGTSSTCSLEQFEEVIKFVKSPFTPKFLTLLAKEHPDELCQLVSDVQFGLLSVEEMTACAEAFKTLIRRLSKTEPFTQGNFAEPIDMCGGKTILNNIEVPVPPELIINSVNKHSMLKVLSSFRKGSETEAEVGQHGIQKINGIEKPFKFDDPKAQMLLATSFVTFYLQALSSAAVESLDLQSTEQVDEDERELTMNTIIQFNQKLAMPIAKLTAVGQEIQLIAEKEHVTEEQWCPIRYFDPQKNEDSTERGQSLVLNTDSIQSTRTGWYLRNWVKETQGKA
ncbi:hypothetical protein JQC92_04170 [Shewanella sp. 202IG2-18]|uniref:hypothetical protein n=1 Tax=Parashewanella hymeniacidonis TaxID=2807618 RepID=UPI001961652A|nr:hypothetical protein [Parashewanella hymeniacidonis]MBM7071239.1 hypothetical protein [Parashewanella hymeniacidonis]